MFQWSYFGYLSPKNEISISKRDYNSNVHFSIVQKNQRVEEN